MSLGNFVIVALGNYVPHGASELGKFVIAHSYALLAKSMPNTGSCSSHRSVKSSPDACPENARPLNRALRRMRQDFSRAKARSPGARSRA